MWSTQLLIKAMIVKFWEFFIIVLSELQREEGRMLIIDEKLSSHLSCEVVKAREQHNSVFIDLSLNNAHLTQPLDVVYLRPLKLRWRGIMDKWNMYEGQTIWTNHKTFVETFMGKSNADYFLMTGIYITNEP